MSIRENVRSMVARLTEREPREISDTADFADDLEMDSLTAAELLVDVEKTYRIQIAQDEFVDTRTLDRLVALIEEHIDSSGDQMTA